MDIAPASSASSAAATPVEISHPEKIMFPDHGYTKQDVADYYQAVSEHLLDQIRDRPLSLIRCPSGISGKCFFQKHQLSGKTSVGTVRITEADGDVADYLVVRTPDDLMTLVQNNSLEFHPWGSLADAPELADRIVFDLDPGDSVSWTQIRAAARQLRDMLLAVKLQSFVRTSGGKGLHVVVPLNPRCDWRIVKPFAKSFAESLALLEPDKFVATSAKASRAGRIFIDYLRNSQGATSVASYSLRARAGAPVATPLSWDELSRVRAADAYTIKTIPARLAKMKANPWQGIDATKQDLRDLTHPQKSAKK